MIISARGAREGKCAQRARHRSATGAHKIDRVGDVAKNADRSMARMRGTAGVIAGALCALVGMLPWLVHGARLTVQNLWATATVNPADMPVVLLPFSQYQLDLAAAIMAIGAGLAAGAARILAARGVQHARSMALAGALIVQIVALVQTATAVSGGLRHPDRATGSADDSTIYLAVVTAWIVVAMAIGVAVFTLITRSSRSLVVIGTAIAAVLLEAWIRGFVAPISAIDPNSGGLFVAHWLPAALLGAVVGWAGLRSWRAVVAAAGLVILWLGSAAIIAIAAAAGSRVLARAPGELLRYFSSVFVAELGAEALMLALVAAGCAAISVLVGVGVRRLTGKSHQTGAQDRTENSALF
jgi:hypothetical protein